MDFYSIKGVAALVAVALLFLHMRAVRRGMPPLGQWLRYLSLLYFGVLTTGASIDQLASDAPINWYNIGGLVGALLLIVAMVVSIHENREGTR